MNSLRYAFQSTLTKSLIAIVLLGILVSTVIILAPGKTIIPNDIKSQVTTTILVPKGSGYSLDKESTKYSKADKLLTFKFQKDNKTLATITEQPTPETFTDIPEFAGKFFTQAGEYKTFEAIQ